ncbi:MAG: hypothetical protein B5766_12940 [Candidatus Lumbricidophila eiseniae]|uniref:Uncharacterized protein n=1 Tax=Candidatus Lumbricidiphila eiseniae TaxID=1969409 RepID=A0A2A6FML9_9MICO|nr:MAG: hypothetical protein B5766_12940 [Candidatus Lumbricidophila eiseniae]
MVDLDALTTGDIAQIEDLSGQSITALSDRESPKGLALAAIAMVIARRNGKPDFTWEQALALSVVEANAILEPAGESADERKDERSAESATV